MQCCVCRTEWSVVCCPNDISVQQIPTNRLHTSGLCVSIYESKHFPAVLNYDAVVVGWWVGGEHDIKYFTANVKV